MGASPSGRALDSGHRAMFWPCRVLLSYLQSYNVHMRRPSSCQQYTREKESFLDPSTVALSIILVPFPSSPSSIVRFLLKLHSIFPRLCPTDKIYFHFLSVASLALPPILLAGPLPLQQMYMQSVSPSVSSSSS